MGGVRGPIKGMAGVEAWLLGGGYRSVVVEGRPGMEKLESEVKPVVIQGIG